MKITLAIENLDLTEAETRAHKFKEDSFVDVEVQTNDFVANQDDQKGPDETIIEKDCDKE